MLIRTRHDLVTARVAAHNQLRAHLLSGRAFHRPDGGISLTFLTRLHAMPAHWSKPLLLHGFQRK